MVKRLIHSAVIWLLVVGFCRAATYYVATNGNEGAAGTDWTTAVLTISNGVAKAAGGDTVLVSNGTYVLTTQIIVNNGKIVRSVNGAVNTVVNGNYPNATNRCFSLTNAILDGFTVMNGYADSGAGVYLGNSTSILMNCVIVSNISTNYGGGMGGAICLGGTVSTNVMTNCTVVFNSGAMGAISTYLGGNAIWNCVIATNWMTSDYGGAGVTLYGGGIQNSTIIGNVATNAEGGGIYSRSGGVISNCIISGNVCNEEGGGIYCYSDSLVQHCYITNNTAGIHGGGVFLDSGGTYNYLRNSTLVGNTACSNAGGVGLNNYDDYITDCIVANNRASNGIGGGLYFYGTTAKTHTVERCRISGNWANKSAGGVYISGGTTNQVLRNCLIVSNSANTNGGGIYTLSGAGWIENCTVVSNVAGGDGGGVGLNSSAPTGTVVQNTIIYYNICGLTPSRSNYYNNAYAFYTNCCTAPTNGAGFLGTNAGNTDLPPRFINFAGGNFRLSIESPCKSTGKNYSGVSTNLDLDGNPRLYGNTVDMGCYEVQNLVLQLDGNSNAVNSLYLSGSNNVTSMDVLGYQK